MTLPTLLRRIGASRDGALRLDLIRTACRASAGASIRLQRFQRRGCFGCDFEEYVFRGA